VEIPIVALAAACFAAAQAAGGSGFIACFVGGLLLSGLGASHKKELLRGAEHMGEALALLTWVVFGGIVVARMIGLANEIYLDVYERPASFEPNVRNLQQRLFDAYAAEVKRVSGNDDGIFTAAQGDIDTSIDGFADNFRPYLPQRPSIALPPRGRSMTGCWHRALPQASAPGCCRVYGCRSAPWWTPRPDVTPTIADVWHRKEAAGRPPSRFATPIRTGCQIGPNNPSQRNSSAICWSARTLRENRSAEWG
jgi:hypothetical protein